MLHGRKEVSFVGIIIFTLCPDASSLNGSVMIINQTINQYFVDGHMGAPLHCYTCAGGGQILEKWGKGEPKCSVVSRLTL